MQGITRAWITRLVGAFSLLTASAGAQTPTRTHTIAHYQLGPTTLYVSVVWFHTILGLSLEAVDSTRSIDILFSADQATEWADTTDLHMTEAHAAASDAHLSTDGPKFIDLNDATLRATSDESSAGKTIMLHLATAHDSTVMATTMTPTQFAALTGSIRDAATAALAMAGGGMPPAVADLAFAHHANRRQVYFEFNVEHPARQANDREKPAYPESLRDKGPHGSVRMQFVVDSSGKADTLSIKVLKSSDVEMTRAAREFLAKVVYTPAQLDGHAVAQLVEENYDFEP